MEQVLCDLMWCYVSDRTVNIVEGGRFATLGGGAPGSGVDRVKEFAPVFSDSAL